LKTEDLPLLQFTRGDGEGALLSHKLTDLERAIFMEMNSATLTLPEDSPLEKYHEAVVPIGAKHGLDAKQSIAFWTRSTFSIFE